MLRTLKSSGLWEDSSIVPIELGGTGAGTPDGALKNLNAIPASLIGQPGGPIPINLDGTVDPKYLADLTTGIIAIDGPLSMLPGETKVWYLTTFDVFTEYTVTAIAGSVIQQRNMIVYTAPVTPGQAGFTINGRTFAVTVVGQGVVAPQILQPYNGSTNRQQPVSFKTSPFAVTPGATDSHTSTDWQVATDSAFTSIVFQAMGDPVNLTTNSLQNLPTNTLLYVRARHNGTALGASPWSATSSFVTAGNWRQRFRRYVSLTAANDFAGQGMACSADGSTYAVGQPGYANGQGAVYVYTLDANGQPSEQKVVAFDPKSNASFGYSVALSSDGKLLAVGAHSDSYNGLSYAGSVYLYLNIAGTWSFFRKIIPQDIEANDMFGEAVALNGDGSWLAVGAAGFKNLTGAVYIFTKDATGNYVEQQKLTAPDAKVGDIFGSAISTSADQSSLIVGARGKASTGAIYRFMSSGQDNHWNLVDTFSPADAATGDLFGVSTALSADGKLLLVGASSVSTLHPGGGAVYVLALDEATPPVMKSKLQPVPGGPSDAFGSGVALDAQGHVAFIGASGNSDFSMWGGSYFVYDNLPSPIAEIEVGKSADPVFSVGEAFGSSVAIDSTGLLAAVGAPNKNGGAGAVEIYSRMSVSAAWSFLTEIVLPSPTISDGFGTAVAFTSAGDQLFITAPGIGAGTVFIYGRVGVAPAYSWTQTKSIQGPSAGVGFGKAIAITANGGEFFVGAPGDNSGKGAVYPYVLNAGLWGVQPPILPDAGFASTGYGAALAVNIDGTFLAVHSDEADGSGAVYFYRLENGAYALKQRLQGSDTVTGDGFGLGLAMPDDGGMLYIGAPSSQGRNAKGGSVYVFGYRTQGYAQLVKLVSNDNVAGDNYGAAVAISNSGLAAVVGAPSASVGGVAAGSIYSYN